MDATQDLIFTTIPREVLVDLLSLLPTSSVISFYSVSSAHLKLFDTSHGLWEQLTRKIFHWSASGAYFNENNQLNDVSECPNQFSKYTY